MPRKWKRSAARGQFSAQDLNITIEKVCKGKLSKREAARTCRIGRATTEGEASKVSKMYGNTSSAKKEEKALRGYAETCGAMAYGMTIKDLCRLAYGYAQHLHKTMPPTWIAEKATGECWAWGFRKRNNMSLRMSENISIARATAFNSENVKIFHNVYENALAKHEFGPESVWNLDETGVSSD